MLLRNGALQKRGPFGVPPQLHTCRPRSIFVNVVEFMCSASCWRSKRAKGVGGEMYEVKQGKTLALKAIYNLLTVNNLETLGSFPQF